MGGDHGCGRSDPCRRFARIHGLAVVVRRCQGEWSVCYAALRCMAGAPCPGPNGHDRNSRRYFPPQVGFD